MGYNTTVVVMNDALSAIAKDGDFGKKLKHAIGMVDSVSEHRSLSGGLDVSAMGYVNAAAVIETHHADRLRAIAVGGNMGIDVGYFGSYKLWNQPVEMLKILAEQHGYTLRKKPVSPVRKRNKKT